MQDNSILRLAVAQSHTLSTKALTLAALAQIANSSAKQSVDLILFPEAYLGGYPRRATFGTAVGARDPRGREQFLSHFKDAIDLGDSPEGGGEQWVRKEWEKERDEKVVRGDGTREELEKIAREAGVFMVVGVVERAGGTLYCAVIYICPRLGVIGKRRKVMPHQTGSERLIWGQGKPSSLRAVTTTIRGVKLTLAAAICWENYMPLLRYSLYSQNVNLYLAPTADARDTWLPLMRTVACEGRCFVLSSNQCIRKDNLPEWISGIKDEEIKKPEIDGAQNRLGLRRGSSVFTEDGHEIALPVHGSGVTGQAETSQFQSRKRRKSVFTEDGHEIALPCDDEDEADSTSDVKKEGLAEFSQRTNGSDITRQKDFEIKQSHSRRKSVMTPDGHQIVLPCNEDEEDSGTYIKSNENGTRNRRRSVVIENGHEIALPSNGDTMLGRGVRPEPFTRRADDSEFACKGGSCIISPFGDVLAGPLWERENEILTVDVDFDDCWRGRLDLDVAGSYSRNDAFKLTVEGLDITPPF